MSNANSASSIGNELFAFLSSHDCLLKCHFATNLLGFNINSSTHSKTLTTQTFSAFRRRFREPSIKLLKFLLLKRFYLVYSSLFSKPILQKSQVVNFQTCRQWNNIQVYCLWANSLKLLGLAHTVFPFKRFSRSHNLGVVNYKMYDIVDDVTKKNCLNFHFQLIFVQKKKKNIRAKILNLICKIISPSLYVFA